MNNRLEKIEIWISSNPNVSDSAAHVIMDLIASDQDPEDRIAMNEIVVIDWRVEELELATKDKTAIEKLMAMDNVVDIVIDKQGG